MPATRKINCLAVDDEPFALEVLKKYIALVPVLWLTATACNTVEALNVLKKKKVDLVFVNLGMPYLQGEDFVRTLPEPPKVIFTTAFRRSSIEGYDADAVDFLVKPISFDRFLKSVNTLFRNYFPEMSGESIITKTTNTTVPKNHIAIRSERQNLSVAVDEILFIESVKDYIKLILRSKTIISKTSISAIEKVLPADHFIRIHRSFIAARNKVTALHAIGLSIEDYTLPVSRSYRHEVEKALKRT